MKNIPRSQIVSLIFLLLFLIILPVVLNSNQQQKQFLSKAEEISVISPTPSSTITQSSVLPNDIELDIPDYLPEYLRHPNKLFSGRTIRVIGQFDNPTIILSSTKITKQLTIKKNTTEYITIELPVELETDTYNIDIRDGETTKNVTLPIEGLTQEEKQLSNNQAPQYNRQIDHSAIVGRNTIPCCYWEMVMGGDPENKDHLVLIGRGDNADNILRTQDGFATYSRNKLYIISINDHKYAYSNGDPKLSMLGNDDFFWIGLININSVNTGVLHKSSILSSDIESHIIKNVPIDTPPNITIFDYPRVAYDDSSSRIYISNNIGCLFTFPTDSQAGYVKCPIYISDDEGQSFREILYTAPFFDWGPPATMDISKIDHNLYAVYNAYHDEKVNKFRIVRINSLDPSIYSILEGPSKKYDNAPKTSSVSSRVWAVDTGPILKIDNKQTSAHKGRMYLLWADTDSVVNDESFEYKIYGKNFDIFLSYSDDQANTWSNPIKINDDTTEGDQLFPAMDIDQNGIVHIVFLDHRDNQELPQFDVYYAKTEDGIKISKNVKINEFSVPNIHGGRSIGDYLDMIVAYSDLVYIGFPCIKSEEINIAPNATSVCITKLDPNKIENIQGIEGDLNNDGKVDIFDLVTVAKDFGKKGEGFPGDADKNGVVDIFDLVIVAKNFGKKL